MQTIIENISTWFSLSLWPFIKENLVLLIGVWGAIAATLGALFTYKILRPKSKPSIVDPEITINKSDVPQYNTAIGRFIAANDGPKPCNLLNVMISANNLTFVEYKIAEKFILGLADLGKRGGELPALISEHEQKTFSFTSRYNIKRNDELPQFLLLEVTFSGIKEPIRKRLSRIADTNKYR
jgi:hypothetical protein